MSHRKERFTSTLKQCLADILMVETDDPLLRTVFVSEVIVSDDLKTARIFVSSSFLPGTGENLTAKAGQDIDERVSRLMKARGFIKRALAQRMYLKYIPELVFLKHETPVIPGENKQDPYPG